MPSSMWLSTHPLLRRADFACSSWNLEKTSKIGENIYFILAATELISPSTSDVDAIVVMIGLNHWYTSVCLIC